jgi:hypothetical protein
VHKAQHRQFLVHKVLKVYKEPKVRKGRKVLQVHKVQHLQLLVLRVLKDYKALKVQLVLKDLLE